MDETGNKASNSILALWNRLDEYIFKEFAHFHVMTFHFPNHAIELSTLNFLNFLTSRFFELETTLSTI